ncbi:MAG: DUF5011 domain-containing protein [Flavobacteriales bacterium]|nr:DUF5011 domain-containing protein [Crocinitomicaceae bacterium]NBX81094.1 DUF5011 domain-containing protein [Flavobacteriales bacterium]NCA20736.1 DUF5011 domain-containing protein [Crocinitomicaceae bacterium]
MKSTLVLFSIVTIGFISLTGCKKKGCTDATATNYNSSAKKDDASCVYGPTITIIGSSDTTINVGSTYNDPGATAVNKDGSAVDVIVEQLADSVNTATTGVYYVNYKATNANGSATAKRKVNVIIGKDNWLVTWDVTSNCGTTSFPLSGTPSVTSGSNANELVIDNMFTLLGGTAFATISGANINMAEQTVPVTGGEIIFTGTGTMTATGNIININYSYDNTIPLIGGQGTCVATYTKQ